jgi:hypothetical protein
MLEIKINTHKTNPDWNIMEIKKKYSTWGVSSHPNGGVEIDVISEDGYERLVLNQDELKQLISFLQTKVK